MVSAARPHLLLLYLSYANTTFTQDERINCKRPGDGATVARTMAGNAAGIAKARAARSARAAARAALEEVQRQQSQQAQQPPNSVNKADVLASVATVAAVADSELTKSQQGQELAEIMLDQLQPVAVRELGMALGNRTSPTLRFQAACKLLDLGQAKKKRDAEQPADDELMSRLASAFQLRVRAFGAVDAVQIREKDVSPAGSVHSQQPADKQSDSEK